VDGVRRARGLARAPAGLEWRAATGLAGLAVLALVTGLALPGGPVHASGKAEGARGAEGADCGAELPAAHRVIAADPAHAAGVAVAFVPDPAPWAVSRHFGLRGVLCGPARLLRVDADMPAHRHGMNYRPTLQWQEAGRFTAQGLMLHMPGRWRIRFEVETQGRRQWLDHTVEVK
jgi:hypothetical protein